MKQISGFTLIELLVTVAIIGIISATAIAQFSEYRKKTYDTIALSDIRNYLTAQDAYFADHNSYASCGAAASTAECETILPGFRRSANVQVWGFGLTEAFACHELGTKDDYNFGAMTWYYSSTPHAYNNGYVGNLGPAYQDAWGQCLGDGS